MRSPIQLPAALIAALLALPLASAAQANVVVNIDKNTQRMSVSVDGTERYVWPVSTGRPGYDTPNGTFKPFRMEADHFSKEWDDAPMPHSIFFTRIGHAIHGYLDTKNIGRAASHGCVRLAPGNASTLFALVKAEGLNATSVTISGRTPAASPEVARRRAPSSKAAGIPMEIAPESGPNPYYGQRQYYRQSRSYYAQQPYYGQPQPYYGRQQYYGPAYEQPQFARPYDLY